MGVLNQDGKVNCSINVVIDKRKYGFSSLYNCSFIDNDSSEIHCSDMCAQAGLERSVAELNRNISISEVKQALVRWPPCELNTSCNSTTAESRAKIWYQ